MQQTERRNAKNIDEFRDALARRISRFIADEQGCWRGCKERACAAPRIDCSNAPPLPPMMPEQEARGIARVHLALREAIALQKREA